MLLRPSVIGEASTLVYGLLCLSCLLRTHSWVVAIVVLAFNYVYLGLALYQATSDLLTFILATIITISIVALLYQCSNLILGSIVDVPMVPDDSYFGNLSLFYGKHCHEKILYWTHKLGPLFQFTCYGRSIVCITDPGLAKIALLKCHGKGDLNKARSGNLSNLLTLDTNDEWKKRRSKLYQAYCAFSLHTKDNELLILSKVNDLCDSLLAFADRGGYTVDIDRYFGKLTISVVCLVIFGMDITKEESLHDIGAVYEDIKSYAELLSEEGDPLLSLWRWWPSSTNAKLKLLQKKVRHFCTSIFQHIQNEKFMKEHQAAKAYAELANEISKEDMLNEILLTFLAGYENTAHTLSWFVYALCKHMNIQQEAQKHIHNHWDEEFDNADLTLKYPDEYIECVIKETMRKYTVASHSVLRRITDEEGFMLGPHKIPKGTWLYISLYALHNSEKNWGMDAYEFKPERFMTSSRIRSYSTGSNVNTGTSTEEVKTSATADPNDLSFAPFSYGARSCLGMNLALMEVRLTAVQLLSKFTFSFGATSGLEEESYAVETNGALRPRDLLPVLISKRIDE